MTVQKIKSGRIPGLDADNFVGDNGQLFFNEGVGDLRLGDGVTPGGIPLSVGGGGGGGDYTLPTASTTIKGGVKIDGTTIAITNQVIRVGTVPYSSLSGTPTIPTNTNQLTNGSGFITSSALSGLATESYVTSRGYLTAVTWNDITSKPTFATVATSGSYADLTNKPTLFSGSYTDLTNKPTLFSGSYTDLTNKPTIPTNTNELINGAGYITSAALSGYATESYVTGRGYITSAALSGYALTSAIPTDISQLADSQGLLGQGGGGGGTTYITNNIENPFSFSVAGDDSTLREIGNGESIRFAGAGGITITTDEEGKITITGTTVDLTGYATESYVTSQGYITSSALTGYALTEDIPTDNNELTNGAGYITSAALTGLATESYVTSRGYITGLSWDQLTNKPNLASTYSFNIAGTDSTLHQISSDNTIQFKGTGNISVTTNTDGVITVNIPSASVVTDDTAPADPVNGELWWDTVSGNLYIYYDDTWVVSNDYANITDYYQLTSLPDLSVFALRSEITSPENFTFSIAADDSTLREILSNESIKFIGAGGITTASDAEGNITITGAPQDRLTSNNKSAVLNSNGTFSLPTLTAAPSSPQAGQLALADGVSWDPTSQNGGVPYMVIYTGTSWLGMGGGVTMDQVYSAILEFGSAGI
jgi:hypothetical protein